MEWFMYYDDARPHPSDFEDSDAPEFKHRLGTMVAELWHDWFEAVSEVAYQTHRACEFLAENSGPLNNRYGFFDSRFSGGPFEGNGSIDMDKLRQSLQSMDPTQAAKVMHAVQMVQAMEAMLRRRRSRASEDQGTAW
jgi:hypothetical protein